MSYISAVRRGDEVYVWERTDAGRELKIYPAPFYFFVPSDEGEYVGLFGEKLQRLDFHTATEFNGAKLRLDDGKRRLYESDIPPEIRVLSEHYYNQPAPNLYITFLDIEVNYNPEIGFSSVENPYAPINSVALHHMWKDETVLLFVPPEDYDGPTDEKEFIKALEEIEPLQPHHNPKIVFCENEIELLLYLLEEIQDSDVISGWNSDVFDVPYIGKRLVDILGDKYFRMLSFPEAPAPRWRTVEIMNRESLLLDPQGRISVDYLSLYKKYEVSEKPSYKLELISEDVLPDMKKLDYDGSLAQLYRENPIRFARYNIRDTEILRGFEDTLGYAALANVMYHISSGLMTHVGGTLKLAELAINNYCIHELNVRVPDNVIDDNGEGIQGALVLNPQVGRHNFIGSMDINSLYPSAIRSLNISPEKLVGQFEAMSKAQENIADSTIVDLVLRYDDGTEESMSAAEWNETLRARKWAVSGYGTVFDQNEQGVIPAILETWYATRKKYQKLAKTSEDSAEAAYYDRLQFVYKIKLNSLYGALNNAFFRYYDLRMGESTTGTGRKILAHMCASVCEVLDGKYVLPQVYSRDDKTPSYDSTQSVIYGDTDSSYFVTHAETREEAIIIADAVAEKVNKTFQPFMQNSFLCNPGYDDIIKAGREIVADSGIFVDKKRYILNVTDDEGKPVDKLKVMGLDTKKTTLPRAISNELNNFVGRLLRGEEWEDIAEDIVDYKQMIKTTDDLMFIGLPKGVRKVEEYTEQLRIYGDGARLPGHVAGAIFYNQCLEQFGDKEHIPITSGMKIKVFYLTQKYGRFKSIAVPADESDVPAWFRENFNVDRDAHVERLVDNPLQNIVKAVGYDIPTHQSLLTNDLFEF